MVRIPTILTLILVLIMLGCTPPPPPDPAPEPAPTPTPPSTINIAGPTTANVNQNITLRIEGASLAQVTSGLLKYWPTKDIDVLPVQTWAGEPLLIINASAPGTRLIQLMTVINGKLIYAEHILTVGGVPDPVPPDPEPGPDPGPEPDPAPDPVPPPPDFKEPYTLLLIEETHDRSPEEAAAVLSKEIIEYVHEKGWKRYLLDKDVVDKDGKTPSSVKAYIERAVGKGLPWYIVVDADGEIVIEGEIKNEVVLLDVLRRL